LTTKLLAVDDSRTMRQALEHTFAGEDFETVAVEGSAQALNVVAAGDVRIALIDVALSGTDGYALCRSIRERSPNTGVLLLSSKHHPYDEALGKAAGASGTVVKPFDTQVLIDRMLELARQQPEIIADSLAPESLEDAEIVDFGTSSSPPAALEIVEEVEEVAPKSAPRALTSQPPPKPDAYPATNGAPENMAEKLAALGLNAAQADAVIALTREVVEQAVWEVVPELAERLIKEEIRRLTGE
jgi:DNA-binding response OmpR family regulator